MIAKSPVMNALFASLLVVGATAQAKVPVASPVRYMLSAQKSATDTLPVVRIEMRFQGEPDGETVLELPNTWGGQPSLWRCLDELAVSGRGGARLLAGADSAHRVIRHAPGAELVLRYRVVQDRPGVPTATGENPYRPLIQSRYLHFIGDAVFAIPERPLGTEAEFKFGPMPTGWAAASDLEHRRDGRPLTLGDLRESITVAGDFRILTRPRPSGDLRVAIRGQWSFSDDSLTDRIDRIIQAHRSFWGDPDEPFLVTVLPLVAEPGNSSLGGTGRSDAFAFFATENAKEATLNRLIAHEHLHTWFPRRIGRMPQQDEAADYWLSEGFTDFYSFRLLVRDGLWSVSDYLDAVNEVLQGYAESPLRSSPNQTIVDRFWTDPNAQTLPYQRGFLLAMLWDGQLRERSGGQRDLDDIVLAMKRRYAPLRDSLNAPLASDVLIELLVEAGLDARADFERHVIQGVPVLLPEGLLGATGRILTEERPEFTRGFDAQATGAAGGVLAGVDPAGPAYAAGLRDGMRILKRESGRIGDSTVDLVYRVKEGEGEKLVTYRPAGARRFTMQRIQGPDPTATEESRVFSARLAGETRR